MALAVGRLDVDELQSELTVSQFNEWAAFAMLEPFGCGIEDARVGRVASAVYGAQGHKADVSDFIPDYASDVSEFPSDDVLRDKARKLAG